MSFKDLDTEEASVLDGTSRCVRLWFYWAQPHPLLTVKTSGDVSWAADSRNRCISSSFIVVEWLWIPGIFCLATCCRCHRGLCGNWERKHSPATLLGSKMKLVESLLCALGDGVFPCSKITLPPDSHPLFLVAEFLGKRERCSSAAQHSTHVPLVPGWVIVPSIPMDQMREDCIGELCRDFHEFTLAGEETIL